jgi:hypothetical protein
VNLARSLWFPYAEHVSCTLIAAKCTTADADERSKKNRFSGGLGRADASETESAAIADRACGIMISARTLLHSAAERQPNGSSRRW